MKHRTFAAGILTAEILAAAAFAPAAPHITYTAAITASAEQNDAFEYEIVSGNAVLTKYNGYDSEVKIPSKLGGRTVTEIGRAAFHKKGVKKVTLPESVKKIGGFAFTFCKNLESVNIPNGVTEIGENAFSQCITLKSVDIPESVTVIGPSAFSCSGLERVKIPNGVKDIMYYTFKGCGSLADVTIPKSVRTVGNEAFAECTGLKSISVPAGVSDIKGSAFYKCTSLEKITVDKNNKSYCSADGVLYSKDKKTLICCPVQKTTSSFAVPDGVTEIGNDAFCCWDELTELYIPESAEKIGDYMLSSSFRDLVIYGKKGSLAQTYAKKHNVPFKTGEMPQRPLSPKNVSAEAAASGSAVITWDKAGGAEGYEIYMSQSFGDGYKKIKTVKKGSAESFTAAGLKKNTLFYFKLRSFKTVNGKKLYSVYSSITSVKI